jgi:two-component system response regulator (stage 0 sporulation protein F)
MSKKILVVDDQFGVRMLLHEVLSLDGYQTYQASGGKEALQLFDEVKPDLVILDMKMPGMNGLDILRSIRKRPSDVQVFMMTAYGELDMIKEATRLGVKTYFTKPFDIDKLRESVREWFASAHAAESTHTHA